MKFSECEDGYRYRVYQLRLTRNSLDITAAIDYLTELNVSINNSEFKKSVIEHKETLNKKRNYNPLTSMEYIIFKYYKNSDIKNICRSLIINVIKDSELKRVFLDENPEAKGFLLATCFHFPKLIGKLIRSPHMEKIVQSSYRGLSEEILLLSLDKQDADYVFSTPFFEKAARNKWTDEFKSNVYNKITQNYQSNFEKSRKHPSSLQVLCLLAAAKSEKKLPREDDIPNEFQNIIRNLRC